MSFHVLATSDRKRLEYFAKWLRAGSLGKQNPRWSFRYAKSVTRFHCVTQARDAQAPSLLRRFGEDPLPPFGALACRGDQALFAAIRRQGADFVYTKFRRLFEGPLEPVKLHYGQQQLNANMRNRRLHRLKEREPNLVPPDAVRSGQPQALAVAQFIQLTGFRAQHSPQVVGRLAA